MKLSTKFTIGMAMAISAITASAATTLRYSNWLPSTHPFMSQVIKPWIENVERVTENRVKVEILPKVVGTVPTQFEVVRDGLADMSLIVDGYSAGRFNLGGIVELPFLGNDARAISTAYWRIYKKYLEKFGEYENAVPVAKTSVGAMALASGKGPLDTIEKIKGMKIRVPNPTASKIVALLDAAPVNKPISEMYELMSTGVVDGMISSTETIHSFKLAGATKHLLTVPGGIGGAGISFVVNQETLSQLSEKDRKAFWSVSGEVFSKNIANVYRDINQKGRQAVLDQGGQITAASDVMISALRTRLADVDQAWIEKAQAKGLSNAKDVLAEFRSEIRKVEIELAKQ